MADLRLVLTHSPLLGPFSWSGVAAELAGRGLRAEAPAWPRLSSIADGFYPAMAASLAATIDGGGTDPVVLVAHSAAGPLTPALATRLAAPVAAVIFADAVLPHPGRSWFDTAPAQMRDQLRAGAQMGQLPPWDDWWPPGALDRLIPDPAQRQALIAELEPLPLAYFEEPAPDAELDVPGAYLQLSGSYEDEARLAGRKGWPVVRLPLHHLALVTQAPAVAAALQSLTERLGEKAGG